MNMYPILLLFAGGVMLTVGDIVIKKWVIDKDLLFFWISMSLYIVGMLFLAQSFKYKNIAVASIMFVVFNVLTLVAASYILFNEKLTIQQIVGVFIGIISVAILSFNDS